jgi:hypothetical protein
VSSTFLSWNYILRITIGGSFRGADRIIELPLPLKRIKDETQFHLRYLLLDKYFNEYDGLIQNLKGIHSGERCFIVGTAPSLRNTNLSLLNGEIVFGVNSLYKAIDGFSCMYYAVSDAEVWKKHCDNILRLKTTLFLASGVARKHVKDRTYDNVIPLRTKGYMSVSDEFSTDISKYVVGGHTVITDVCLQVAFYMGFREVYLLGTDFTNLGTRFDGSKTENKKALGLVDVDRIFYCLEVCKKAYEKNNRSVFNATPGGALNVFERKVLEDVI